MEKEISVPISHIKEEIQYKIGKRILYTADCQELSDQILGLTKRQISVSTLKRFFGIIKSSFASSKYTLDTLAMFLKYPNWQAYVNKSENNNNLLDQQISWEGTKRITNEITSKSLKSIKNRIGSRLKNFPLRRFAENNIEKFLLSQKIATALIAPDGMGKSTIVAQITEQFFMGRNAKYPDDIICLIDGSIFYNLLSHKQNLAGLSNLIEYNPLNSFSLFFHDHPELVKGRLVLIIDGIDDIYPKNGKTDYFIDNLLNIISSFENTKWFKILITCSPTKWRRFAYRIQQNQLLRSCWFNVSFQGTDDEIINIPPLRKNEIKMIFKKNHSQKLFDDLLFKNTEILDLLNHPYMLHLYLLTYKNRGEISDVDLLNQYISSTILSGPFPEDKFLIIKSFFELCDYGKNGTEIRKVDLNLSASSMMGYHELIRTHILYEYSVRDNYLSLETRVRFSQNILFSFYLANALLKNIQLSIDFLRSIINGYNSKPNLQCNILRYIIKILFREEQTELLKDIFSIFDVVELQEDDSAFNKISSVLTNTIGVELRKSQKIREVLIPLYAQSKTARHLYFEKFFDMDNLVLHSGNDIDCYLKYNQSNKARQYVCFMKFMQYFLSEYEGRCKAEYENSLNLMFPAEKDSSNTAFYFIPQIVYQSVYERKVDERILTAVYAESERLLINGFQSRYKAPMFEFTIVFVLNFGRMNKEIIDLSGYIFQNYDLTSQNSSSYYQLFLAVYARALLESGEPEKAIEFYDQVKFKNINIPEHMKYYMKIRYQLVKAQFLIYKGKLNKARKQLRKIKSSSKLLKFGFFYTSALELENAMLEKT